MSEFNINEDAQCGGEYSGSQSDCNDDPQLGGSSQPVESSAFPDEDEETITMLDVIEREDKLEDEASAVLGFSDEKNCTYPKGYISRQALYSCATCSDGSDTQAAICLACSLECHENHELFELYTKRNYRCDCGNEKFEPNFECKLMDKQTKKVPLNENNKYNHNFSGRYCTCNKRYPPDENDNSSEANDEMWQCIVCEDWYHTKHLGAKELPERFDELICGQCADRLEFVRYYKDIDKREGVTSGGVSESAQLEDLATTKPAQATPEAAVAAAEAVAANDDINNPVEDCTKEAKLEHPTPCESDTNDSQAENKDPTTATMIKQEQDECFLDKLKKEHETKMLNDGKTTSQDQNDADVETKSDQETIKSSSSCAPNATINNGPLFWQDCSWRTKLCKCAKCLSMYKEKECEYLIDDRDTVQYYEEQGRAMAKDRQSPYERGISALNRMNRAAVVEALHGYDELKADLSSYLRKFADNKKVVREEDIHDFFAQLKTKKRQRLEFE